MIVELFGPAGSGKTTVAHSLKHRLRAHGQHAEVVLSYQPGKPATVADPGGFATAFLRVGRAVGKTVALSCRPRRNAEIIRIVFRLVRTFPPRRTIWLVRFGQYFLQLAQVWFDVKDSPHIVIFDQGFVQAVCSLALFNGGADERSLAWALNIAPKSDLIIHVDAPEQLLQQRLLRRLNCQSYMERWFEADPNTNLQAKPIIAEVKALVSMNGTPVISIHSFNKQSLHDAIDTIEAHIRALHAVSTHQTGPCSAALLCVGHSNGDRPQSGADVSMADGRSRPALDDRACLDYRSSHAEVGYGTVYERTYRSGYFAALWEKIERPLLEDIFRKLGGPNRKCLDFACGTGRITCVAARFFARVVGVDVSESMLALARVPANVELRQTDITVRSLEEKFDVVTAFRFFLNAEERLRRDALNAMRDHLEDDGRLVCNVHVNATSPVGLLSRLANRLGGTPRNVISIARFTDLLNSTGFVIEDVVPYGYLPRPGPYLPRLCEKLVAPAERIARALRLPAMVAEHFIVIARKR